MGAAKEVTSAETLTHAVGAWLTEPHTLDTARDRARGFLARQSDQMDQTVTALLELLPQK